MTAATCASARENMLEADLHELDVRAASPLAVHLRACASCRDAARRIVADTRLLAGAVDRRRAAAAGTMRRSRAGGRVVIAALAASVGAIAILRFTSDDGVPFREAPPAQVRASTMRSASVSPPVLAAIPAPSAVLASIAAIPSTASVRPRAFVPAAPISPTAFETATPVVPATGGVLRRAGSAGDASVLVAPPLGRHAAVLRTRDPSVTVVWLY